eukprot:194340-Chlamydomonas_euryale.AAC.3
MCMGGMWGVWPHMHTRVVWTSRALLMQFHRGSLPSEHSEPQPRMRAAIEALQPGSSSIAAQHACCPCSPLEQRAGWLGPPNMLSMQPLGTAGRLAGPSKHSSWLGPPNTPAGWGLQTLQLAGPSKHSSWLGPPNTVSQTAVKPHEPPRPHKPQGHKP